MYDGIQSYGGVDDIGFAVCLYFVVLFICGNCILFYVISTVATVYFQHTLQCSGRHDIAEILLKVALNTTNQIKST
jgi:hypothetical protein